VLFVVLIVINWYRIWVGLLTKTSQEFSTLTLCLLVVNLQSHVFNRQTASSPTSPQKRGNVYDIEGPWRARDMWACVWGLGANNSHIIRGLRLKQQATILGQGNCFGQ